MPRNLYVHFPFCRRKCTYCALYSRVGVSQTDRNAYVRQLAQVLQTTLKAEEISGKGTFETVYFGGGSPALCDLSPLFEVLFSARTPTAEFTVELHPLDVTDGVLTKLKEGGVNRISMGVQSLDDETLLKMGRGHTVAEARLAFQRIRRFFDNAGIDLIVGYPDDPCGNWMDLRDWGLQHCSVYALILEEKSILSNKLKRNSDPRVRLPSDDEILDQIASVKEHLAELGLARYEISNYAVKGYECRHNLAVWKGEDYLGLGAGAFGRIGLKRTQNWGLASKDGFRLPVEEYVTPEQDRKERTLFRLRTRLGLETHDHPEWEHALQRFVSEELLTRDGTVYRLTERGTEVCDTILAELV